MATQVADSQHHTQVQKSDFQGYMENNPQMLDQMMRIIVNLYTDPKKISETQEHVRKMLSVPEAEDPQELIEENKQLKREIFDLQDQLVAFEEELDAIKEETL